MCVIQVWTYNECGCRYFYPIPCSDRILHSPSKSYKTSENLSLISSASSSSLLSIFSRDRVTEAKDSVSTPPHRDVQISEFEDETDTNYRHRLRLVRTCSLRRTVQKTFLEPICDDCLLAELGLTPQAGSVHGRHESGGEDEEATLTGAEWLLESNVEITVKSPPDDATIFPTQSKPCSSSDDDKIEDRTPRRGRGGRRALEITREYMLRDNTSLPNSPSSFRKFRHIGQRLKRARKQEDLKSPATSASRSNPPSVRSLSWIEHLRSDLRERFRRRRPDIMSEAASSHRTDSLAAVSSFTAEEQEEEEEEEEEEEGRVPSLPSIPATASSTYSSTSAGPGGFTILPLVQLISSSEFESSQLSAPNHLHQEQQMLDPDRDARGADRKSMSSSSSARSFHTATEKVSRPASPAKRLARDVEGIALHSFSYPLFNELVQERSVGLEERQEEMDAS